MNWVALACWFLGTALVVGGMDYLLGLPGGAIGLGGAFLILALIFLLRDKD